MLPRPPPSLATVPSLNHLLETVAPLSINAARIAFVMPPKKPPTKPAGGAGKPKPGGTKDSKDTKKPAGGGKKK